VSLRKEEGGEGGGEGGGNSKKLYILRNNCSVDDNTTMAVQHGVNSGRRKGGRDHAVPPAVLQIHVLQA